MLYGPDTMNQTIEYEFTDFHELLALDLQGYPRQLHTDGHYSEVFLHHNALINQLNLRYLNIERIRLFPNPNSTVKEIPAEAYTYIAVGDAHQRTHFNITFVQLVDPEVLPYSEYKKQKSIISTFNHLTYLKSLRLFHCQLETITWEMFDGLINVRTLSLEGNELNEIPEYAFYGMPELRSLILAGNKLRSIHNNSLAGLFKLESLDLSNNNLKYLSDLTFAPLPRLQQMDLMGNPLENISSNTFELAKMTLTMRIDSTSSLTIYKHAFIGLSKLEKLELLGLNITTLETGMLAGMTNLEHLHLGGQIKHLAFDAFSGSPLLQELILRHCSIMEVSVDAFYGLSQLKRLDLSQNELITLPPGVFDQLSSLKELILSHNYLVTVPREVFQNLQYVQMIRLDENPWNCSCEMINWSSLNLNKEKKIRIGQQCNYQYDKSPCVSTKEVTYVYNPKLMPKCFTPKEYYNWNVLYTVNNALQCTIRRKRVFKNLKKVRKSMPRYIEPSLQTTQRVTHLDEAQLAPHATDQIPNVKKTTPRPDDQNPVYTTQVSHLEVITRTTEIVEQTTRIEEEPTDADNNIGDLSQFLSYNENYGPVYRSHKKTLIN